MEVVVDFKDAHLLTKVALVTISVADLILLIGVSTNYWYHESYRYLIHLGNPHFGLWRGGYYLSFWQATQAMECIGLILGVIALILVILYLFVDQFRGNKNIVLYSLVSAIAAGIFITIGIIIWGTHYPSYQLGWSFALACVGGVFLFLAGLLLIPEKKPQLI
ncbi:uncharacterized protein LOC135468702 isoform X1 [Liolophura sinensis]|uniref:uncharacterized protein LOC135468702 isoform X1 n=1 Tax=Liolophura sinensis TaxID=3198878 RepID=UPI0031597967